MSMTITSDYFLLFCVSQFKKNNRRLTYLLIFEVDFYYLETVVGKIIKEKIISKGLIIRKYKQYLLVNYSKENNSFISLIMYSFINFFLYLSLYFGKQLFLMLYSYAM